MIDILQGVVASVTEQRLTVLVHGVGYSVAVPNTTQYHMKQDVNLFIYMHWNQERGPVCMDLHLKLSVLYLQ
jgi:Holliday junction resolvasome RuvABC DNA-binding subunit